jgi:dCMP deaminase
MGSTSITEALPTPSNARESWPRYFMRLATDVASRSTCSRLRVGAVFVRDNRILCTGYNGSLPGRPHCDDVGCMVHENHCIATVHAETNAIAQAAQHGVSLQDSFLYVTHVPCISCYVIVLAAGCSRVHYQHWYGSTPIEVYRQFQGMSRLEQVK